MKKNYKYLIIRGGEWYFEKRGSRKILAGSRNLERVFDKSRSLVFAWFVLTLFEIRNFLPRSLGLGFLTGISASRRVSDFTIRHPYYSKLHEKNHLITYLVIYMKKTRWLSRRNARVSRNHGKIAPSRARTLFENKRFDWF